MKFILILYEKHIKIKALLYKVLRIRDGFVLRCLLDFKEGNCVSLRISLPEWHRVLQINP